MSMIDYGAIVFKNGKCITNDIFTDMKESVGWEDTSDMLDQYGNLTKLKGNYFTYIGDDKYTIAFYKDIVTVCEIYNNNTMIKNVEYLNCNGYTWTKWEPWLVLNCVVKHHNGYYVLRWKYKGNKYKVYFGHGVDISSYKKWHIVNYYRSIPFYVHKIIHKIKYGW